MKLFELLKKEQEADRQSYTILTQSSSIAERRANGLSWFPVAIRDTEMSRGDYIIVELERTTHFEIVHQFRFGAPAAIFSNHQAEQDRIEGIVSYQCGNKIKITLRTDELPEWCSDGKLGIDLLFDSNSYEEMQNALNEAMTLVQKKEEGRLIRILTGENNPEFHPGNPPFVSEVLNKFQQSAVDKILSANELAIVHGPPGTGKTTTLVQAVKALIKRDHQQLLVVAPSNTAVDLLTEKLTDEKINVIRIGNPARVSERLMSLTLDSKIAEHPRMKEMKKLKKQAAAFRDMAHKYKRNFGKAEREQRKALFDEARNIMKEVNNTEQYIVDDLLSKAQVITATLVGANHYTIRHLRFHTAIIDEAGQALEPACWIPILKANKIILAGDHCQLSPTIKSNEGIQSGLATTLLEKTVALHPLSVVLLQEQYRMNELIMGYSSKTFYNNQLKEHVSVAHHLLYSEDKPLLFIDTAGCGFDEQTEGTSTSNPEEASFLFKHLTQFITTLSTYYSLDNFPTIGIISPYKRQVDLLKEQWIHSPALHSYGEKISVNTIDSFQGQERDIIYISMTRSNADNKIGFLSETRRMNVAMTRARKKLVIIGDSATLSQLPFYANFITYAEKNNSYQSAWEFIEH